MEVHLMIKCFNDNNHLEGIINENLLSQIITGINVTPNDYGTKTFEESIVLIEAERREKVEQIIRTTMLTKPTKML